MIVIVDFPLFVCILYLAQNTELMTLHTRRDFSSGNPGDKISNGHRQYLEMSLQFRIAGTLDLIQAYDTLQIKILNVSKYILVKTLF